MFDRLGQKRAKFFAKIDLTSGYHQIPVDEACRHLLAFITPFGLFEWCRLPMGPKGAGSYFQQMMQKILAGLLYVICEVYLDDILVYGATEEEFLHNLELVFQRLQEYNLSVSPDKCHLGMSKVEYVGLYLDETGYTFTAEKKDSVLNFPQPESQKHMKSFLGLCNYFHTHVPNYASIAKPLHEMITPYHPSYKIRWTEDQLAKFAELKQAIFDCQKLTFIDPNAGEIHVHTDASKYGIGAIVSQIVGEETHPIYCLSKTLSTGQQKWSTPEKECWAILYTFTKLEYLLRDARFTLHTDHKNLTFLASNGSEKVKRWKLAIQEYDCAVNYIKGEYNSIADALSRLCSTEPFDDESDADVDTTDELFAMCEIPERERAIIEQVHNTYVGHFGVEETLKRLRARRHEWQYMRTHVKDYVRTCPLCQKMSYIKPSIITRPFTGATYARSERYYVDSIGPLPEDELGQTHYGMH